METYRIRPARVSDAGVIATQRVAMFREMGELEYPGDIATLESATRRRLTEQIDGGEYIGWLAEHQTTVVGGAGVLIHQILSIAAESARPTAYVLNVYTDPAHRKQGIASRLMEAITQGCVEQDIPRISLHTSEDGRRLYERLGFAVSHEMRISVRELGRVNSKY